MPEGLLQMGRIGKPHGIKGAVTADWFGEHEPQVGDTILLQSADGTQTPYTLEAVTWHKGRLILKLQSIVERNSASTLTGQSILFPRDAVQQPKTNEAFLADLPGCRIMDENGTYLGILDHLEYPAGQIIWAISAPDGHEILFPGRPEFIKKLDVGTKEIVVAPPNGLLDIYHA